MGCPFQRKTLVVVVGSSGNIIRISVCSAPNCFQKKLELPGGVSEYVPVSLLNAGPLISSTVEVVVCNSSSGKLLHTYPPLPPHSLAQYKKIRLTVDAPFTMQLFPAPAGFWLNFFGLLSFGFRTQIANRGPSSSSDDIESQGPPSPSEQKNENSSIEITTQGIATVNRVKLNI